MTGFTSLIKALKIISIAGEVMALEVIFARLADQNFFYPLGCISPKDILFSARFSLNWAFFCTPF